MKKSIILGLLLLPIFIFGQSKVQVFSSQVFQTPSVVSNPPFFNLKNYTFQLRSVKFAPEPDFTVYNRTTQLNDLYNVKKDTFYYQKSVFIPENHLFGTKTDSFNPGGAPDLGSALVLGLLNTIFGKIQVY
jgi:hypothetical protein